MTESLLNFEKFKHKIEQIKNLPTIPVVAFQVMGIIADENSSIRDLEKIISTDPPLTAKIIKVANSTYYRTAKEITSLHMALVILGMEEVRNIVFAVSLYSSFHKLNSSKYFLFEDFWKHSAGTGKVALALAKYLKVKNENSAFVSGLLHDIGRLILQSFFEEEYNKIYLRSLEQQKPLVEVEKELLGFTHQEVGLWLSQRWNIPKSISEVVGNHHFHSPDHLDYPDLVAVISVADHITRIWGVSVEPLPRLEPLESMPAFQYLSDKYDKINKIDWKKWAGLMDMELDEAENFVRNINLIVG
ncbi:MAG: HDOD domain-containing protein [Calditrichia bacterium]